MTKASSAGWGLLITAVVALAGCQKSSQSSNLATSPTTKADERVLVHKATIILNACLPPGVKAQATPLQTIAQPVFIDDFLQHGTRSDVEKCWKLHGVKHGVTGCVLSQIAQAPSDLRNASGRGALGQAIFTACLVSNQ